MQASHEVFRAEPAAEAQIKCCVNFNITTQDGFPTHCQADFDWADEQSFSFRLSVPFGKVSLRQSDGLIIVDQVWMMGQQMIWLLKFSEA